MSSNKSTQSQFTLTVSRQTVSNLLPEANNRSLRSGWCTVMYDAFHSVQKTCALTFDSNYLSSVSRYNKPWWAAYGHCKVPGCIKVKFQLLPANENEAEYTVRCTVTGTVTHENVHDACMYTFFSRPILSVDAIVIVRTSIRPSVCLSVHDNREP